MILEYKKETSVLEKDAYVNEVDGQRVVKDLMITYYTPINFEGTVKNYCLGYEHPNWERMHAEYEERMHKEWLVELEIDPEKYHVNSITKAVCRTQDIGNIKTPEMEVTLSEEI